MLPSEVERQLVQARLDIAELKLGSKNSLNTIKDLMDKIADLKTTVSTNGGAAAQPIVNPILENSFRFLVTFFAGFSSLALSIFSAGFITNVAYVGVSATVKRLKIFYDTIGNKTTLDSKDGIAFTDLYIDGLTLFLNFLSVGLVSIGGNLLVGGNINTSSSVISAFDVTTGRDAIVTRNLNVTGTAALGTTTVTGNLSTTVDLTSGRDLGVTRDLAVIGTMSVVGISTLSGSTGICNNISITSTGIGFFGAAVVVKQTLNAYTTNIRNVAYTGVNNAQVGTPYALVLDMNNLRAAYENLRASFDDLRSKLRTTTLVG